jgi:hypothetical protein
VRRLPHALHTVDEQREQSIPERERLVLFVRRRVRERDRGLLAQGVREDAGFLDERDVEAVEFAERVEVARGKLGVTFECEGDGVLGRRVGKGGAQVVELRVGVVLFAVVEQEFERRADFPSTNSARSSGAAAALCTSTR